MAQDMGHANDLLKAVREFAERYLPTWLVTPLIAIGLVLFLLKYFGAGQIAGRCWNWLKTRTGDKRRALRRSRFADHVESQMRRLGEKEEWRDHRYAELEAELEVTGRPRMRLFRRTALNSLKRVPSLSIALEECEDRIVLLEGEPGSGKSVAMRHLTQRMAGRAMRRPSEFTVIPIYVNLKTFQPAAKPTAEDVRAFVLTSINSARDRDIAQFLEEEFDRGMREGGWLILFDSFDEIPEILSATSANEAIEAYADAVHAFLHGMNTCRGVVASREFRGPGRASWPTFKVVPLSDERRRLLIKNADLPHDVENELVTTLPHAEPGVQHMSGNPLFLGLLCEHMRQRNDFPTNVHAVLETYIKHRFVRDEELVRGNFDVSSEDVRAVAEELAFLIASRDSLGLNVPKAQAVRLLVESLRKRSDHVARALDALIYTKIARTGDDDTSVTFSHRRLQEYFATCVVIREPDRIPVRTLLTSGRWRETAVTILQTQEAGHASRLMEEAARFLPEQLPAVTDFGFEWPDGLLHVLGILAEGGASMPAAGALLTKAWDEGTVVDRKWALEVCSIADSDTCREMLSRAFASSSEWLRQEAFQQTRRVPQLTGELKWEIREMLVDLTAGGTLRRERRAIFAQVRRTPDPKFFERVLWVLLIGPYAHAAAVVAATALLVHLAGRSTPEWSFFATFFVLSGSFYPYARMLFCRSSSSVLQARASSVLMRESLHVMLASISITASLVVTLLLVMQVSVLALLLLVLNAVTPFLWFRVAKRGTSWSMPQWDFSLPYIDWKEELLLVANIGGTLVVLWTPFLVLLQLLRLFVGDWWIVSFSLFIFLVIAVLVVFVVASGALQAFKSLADFRAQRRWFKKFKSRLDSGCLSAPVIHDHLLGVSDEKFAYLTYLEMNKRDIRWPDDVVLYLQRMAMAARRPEHSPLPGDVADRRWTTSPDVLDQLGIFLASQRKKAEAIPR